MIYVDSSVVLAELFAEDRRPLTSLWDEPLVSSRLLEFEVWNRIHANRSTAARHDAARDLLGRIGFIELLRPVLERALEPFPTPVRTLDALHLASAEFLRGRETQLTLATYDERMRTAALALKIPLAEL